MLHTKAIGDISYQDVVDFCAAGHVEGSVLEFKRDFASLPNDKLAKTVAAFANTYGGLLVIGVNAPNGKAIPPIEGFEFDPTAKYEERIESVVLSHVKEPVFPEIRVCVPVNGKTFIVIRVAESHLTPHRTSDNTKTYVRTGQSSTPNKAATWDQIEWLASRREKSEELRELLCEEGDRYFRDACKLRGINLEDKDAYFAVASARVIPLFPQGQLIPFRELGDIGNEIRVRDRSGNSFPYDVLGTEAIQNGVRKLSVAGDDGSGAAHGREFEYVHINSFGLYLYKRDVGMIDQRKVTVANGAVETIKIKRMHFSWIARVTHQFLASSLRLYEKLGYRGTVRITIELRNGLGVRMLHPLKGAVLLLTGDDLVIPSDLLKWEKTVAMPLLRAQMQDIVTEIVDAAAWSLGVRYFSQEQIRQQLAAAFGE